MSTEALFENATRHIKAIDLCIENNLRVPALILIYSGIDIFSSLNRPIEKDVGTREDFKMWCDLYMLSQNELPCSSVDLYAARCGVIHSSSSESKLSRNNQAKEIIYSWGNQTPEPLQGILNKVGIIAYVIQVETLADVFKKAVQNYLNDVKEDSDRINLIVQRAANFFKDQPKEFWR